jgi:hypothetical protein
MDSLMLTNLPTDLLLEIIKHLSYSDAMALCHSCYFLYRLLIVDNFGYVWKHFYHETISSKRLPDTVTAATLRQIQQEFSVYLKKTRFLQAIHHGYEILAKNYLDALPVMHRQEAINDALYSAAKEYPDILEWLREFNPRQLYRAVEGAASVGNLALVDRLLPTISSHHLGPSLYEAAKGGHREVLTLLISISRPKISYAIQGAAEGNHRDLLMELLNDFSYYNTALFGAATGGHADLIKELIERGAALNSGMLGAVNGNQVDWVKWFEEQGIPLTQIPARVSYTAMQVLEYLVEQRPKYNCQFQQHINCALELAARDGQFDIVKKILLWNPSHLTGSLLAAEGNGYPEIADYIRDWSLMKLF